MYSKLFLIKEKSCYIKNSTTFIAKCEYIYALHAINCKLNLLLKFLPFLIATYKKTEALATTNLTSFRVHLRKNCLYVSCECCFQNSA